MDMQIRRPGFFPVHDATGKPHSKRYFLVEPDGSVTERVFLDVPDIRAREELICLHYLKNLVRHFLREDVGIRIVARDDPWDFSLELSTGQALSLEITSIADNAAHFEINKREERLALYEQREFLTIRELRQILRWFDMPHIENVVRTEEAKGAAADQMVSNPLARDTPRVFLSANVSPRKPLAKTIEKSIRSKIVKPHGGKEDTVLILDNRTSVFDIPEYIEAAESLAPFLEEIPFREVWFYTGYYSDTLGNDAEFSLAPLKVTPDQQMALAEIIATRAIDQHGRVVW